MKARIYILAFIILAGALFIIYPLFWPARYPDEYWITDYAIGDLDHDGAEEIVVLLLKRGYYGPSLPFWLTDNIDDYGNHLFIYELSPSPKLKWGSSTINSKIDSISIQAGYLIVNQTETWQWDDFGLTRIK